jgi:hypothetical protein
MEKLQGSMGYRHGICVDGKGKSGGMALWWRDGIDVSIQPWCQYYIDAMITYDNTSWRFTGIYGNQELSSGEKRGRYHYCRIAYSHHHISDRQKRARR